MSYIEVKDVSKSYGKVQALKNVSVIYKEGKIHGFLGRNGAGKTTLLNIITNRIFADRGQVYIDGEPAVENDRAQAKIFYMSEKNPYPADMKVNDVFQLSQNFFPNFDFNDACSLSDDFKLNRLKKIGGLSTGYLSIFKIVLTLASHASILIFDEPVLGLDANHRDLFYKALLAGYRGSGTTVILSTHLINEVADLLDEVVLIKEGKDILTQSTEGVLAHAYTLAGNKEAVDHYIAGKKVVHEELWGNHKIAVVWGSQIIDDQQEILRMNLEIIPARLQDIIIYLTN